MEKSCIVTGGAGFIGCALSGMLADNFDSVVAIDNLHPQVHPTRVRPSQLDQRVELLVGDVCDVGTWDRVLDSHQPDVVVHLAAETGTGQSLTEATRHASVNVVGTTVMLDAFSRRKVFPERLVLSSSRAVYGEGAWLNRESGEVVYPGQRSKQMLENGLWDFPGLKSKPFTAISTHTQPTSIYGATKLAQEQILSAWCMSMGVEAAILRLQNVYGPGQSLTNPYTGIVPFFSKLAKNGQSIPVYEDGQIIRDFVYINDVASALASAAIRGVQSVSPYDIGLGERTSILELAELISQRYGAPRPHINGKFRHGDVRSAACDIGRTVADLSWKPTVSLHQGINELCAWIDAKDNS